MNLLLTALSDAWWAKSPSILWLGHCWQSRCNSCKSLDLRLLRILQLYGNTVTPSSKISSSVAIIASGHRQRSLATKSDLLSWECKVKISIVACCAKLTWRWKKCTSWMLTWQSCSSHATSSQSKSGMKWSLSTSTSAQANSKPKHSSSFLKLSNSASTLRSYSLTRWSQISLHFSKKWHRRKTSSLQCFHSKWETFSSSSRDRSLMSLKVDSGCTSRSGLNCPRSMTQPNRKVRSTISLKSCLSLALQRTRSFSLPSAKSWSRNLSSWPSTIRMECVDWTTMLLTTDSLTALSNLSFACSQHLSLTRCSSCRRSLSLSDRSLMTTTSLSKKSSIKSLTIGCSWTSSELSPWVSASTPRCRERSCSTSQTFSRTWTLITTQHSPSLGSLWFQTSFSCQTSSKHRRPLPTWIRICYNRSLNSSTKKASQNNRPPSRQLIVMSWRISFKGSTRWKICSSVASASWRLISYQGSKHPLRWGLSTQQPWMLSLSSLKTTPSSCAISISTSSMRSQIMQSNSRIWFWQHSPNQSLLPLLSPKGSKLIHSRASKTPGFFQTLEITSSSMVSKITSMTISWLTTRSWSMKSASRWCHARRKSMEMSCHSPLWSMLLFCTSPLVSVTTMEISLKMPKQSSFSNKSLTLSMTRPDSASWTVS